jgi:hypothetical protein
MVHCIRAFGGYSSAYYTYLWDKVIAEDFFSQFGHNNLLAGTPMRYRHGVATGRLGLRQYAGEKLPGARAKHGRVQEMDAEEFAGVGGCCWD